MARNLFELMRTLLPEQPHRAAWRPAADVYQTAEGWLVKFDLAGVRPEDVELSHAGNRLTVRGTRRDASVEEGAHCYHMEIAYSHFERSIELPYDPGRARITSEYRAGMLLVRIQTDGGGDS